VVGLVVVRMMNTQAITKFVLGHAAELAGEAVARPYLRFERLGEPRRVLRVGDAALPHRVALAAQRLGDAESPFPVLRHPFASLARRLPLLRSPRLRHLFSSLGAVLPSCSAGLDAFVRRALEFAMFFGSLVRRSALRLDAFQPPVFIAPGVSAITLATARRLAVHRLTASGAGLFILHRGVIIP
jgi:hypothetical protein